ncbi:MAG: hypothetical protein M3128_01485 [Verrucomicrobiota bacterium]|nr:hypothetical protein [Verrucomicrobiota bacterium]
MKLLRNRMLRLSIVAIAAAAWLAISNHCAIAAVEGVAKLPMPSCHGGAAEGGPVKHEEKGGLECCKVLRATLLTLSGNLAAFDISKFASHDYVVGLTPIIDHARTARIIEWDTGPPSANSFAETVLQRSILAHAPPSLA